MLAFAARVLASVQVVCYAAGCAVMLGTLAYIAFLIWRDRRP